MSKTEIVLLCPDDELYVAWSVWDGHTRYGGKIHYNVHSPLALYQAKINAYDSARQFITGAIKPEEPDDN